MKNYSEFFRALLRMEELQLEENMRSYGMEGVSIRRRGDFWSLEVPGLAEKRPSLVPGDCIVVSNHSQNDAQPYKGVIHRVEADKIILRLEYLFHEDYQPMNKYDVTFFSYNETSMRRLSWSVCKIKDIRQKILFPCKASCTEVNKEGFDSLNPSIDPEQADAIKRILGLREGAPYVIYGPPGTVYACYATSRTNFRKSNFVITVILILVVI